MTFVNRDFCEYYGPSPQELIGVSYLDLLPNWRRAQVVNNINILNPDRTTISKKISVRTPNNKIQWQLWTDQGLFNNSGELLEIQSIGHILADGDVSEETANQYAQGISAIQEANQVLIKTLPLDDTLGQILDAAGAGSRRDPQLSVCRGVAGFCAARYPAADEVLSADAAVVPGE